MRNQKLKTNIIIAVLIVACIGVGAMIVNNLNSSNKAADVIDNTQDKQKDVKVDIEEPKEKKINKDKPIEVKAAEDPKEAPSKKKEVKNVDNDAKEDKVTSSQDKEEAVQKQAAENTKKQPEKEEAVQAENKGNKPAQSNNQATEPVEEEIKVESKPASTNDNDGGSLVPDSDNPFKQPIDTMPNNGTRGEMQGSDYYEDGVPAGQGDKF